MKHNGNGHSKRRQVLPMMMDRQGNLTPKKARGPYSVCVLWPAQDACKTWFAYDAARLMCYTVAASAQEMERHGAYVESLEIRCITGTLIAPQRRDLVRAAQQHSQKFTHVLWMDTDMRFPKESLLRLLAHDKPIVAASYATRRLPIRVTAVREFDPVRQKEPICEYTRPEDTGLKAVRSVGMGLMLVSMDVFDKIEQPWFTVEWKKEWNGYEGEDVSFCRRAHEAGYDVFIDHDLSKEVVHLGDWEYAHEHALVHLEEAVKQTDEQAREQAIALSIEQAR